MLLCVAWWKFTDVSQALAASIIGIFILGAVRA
jgi:hypothetical protein